MAATLGLLFALFACAFALGSIPWGVIVSRLCFGMDIRSVGSGNIGATNAVRAMGAKGGALVFLLDMAKGLIAGFLGCIVWPHITDAALLGLGEAWTVCGGVAFVGCVWGHIFCPWLGFKGGKGISTALGCELFAITPLGAGLEIAVFLVFVAATRYVSLGSVLAAAALPFIALWLLWGQWMIIICSALVGITVIWAHRENIKRLLAHEERKLSFSKRA